jgi:WD40 repeat protein
LIRRDEFGEFHYHIDDSIKTLTGHSFAVSSLALLENGLLASSSFNDVIIIWNVTTGQIHLELGGHMGTIFSLATLSDGKLASGSDDKTIKIWNLKEGKINFIFVY